jgi:hypothetical protein
MNCWALCAAPTITFNKPLRSPPLNSVVLSLMDLHQVANVARQRRRFASHPHEALAWVLDF